MSTEALEAAFGRQSVFGTVNYVCRLVSAVPIDSGPLMKLAEALKESFPKLQGPRFDADEDSVRLSTDATRIQDSFSVEIEDSRAFSVSMGVGHIQVWSERTSRLASLLHESTLLLTAALELIDTQLVYRSDIPGNYHQLLADALHRGNILGSFAAQDTINSAQMHLSGLLDENRIWAIRSQTNVSTKEVRTAKFKNDRLLLGFGLGQTKGFASELTVRDALRDHEAVFFDVASHRFIPTVLSPIIDRLATLKESAVLLDEGNLDTGGDE